MYIMQDCSTAETLEKIVSLLQFMIRNPLEIFEVSVIILAVLQYYYGVCVSRQKVPHEVQVVAERYCKKRETTQVHIIHKKIKQI